MDTAMTKAASVLHTAEMGVRALVEETASKGDYDAALRLVQLARSLQDMAGGLSATLDAPIADATQGAGAGRPRTAVGRANKQNYPRFYRRGADLVKVGWSKANKTEYEHKAPKPAVLALVHSLETLAGRGFAVEEILPLSEQEDSEIPAYQVYLCLAWLRVLGVVKRHGRQGYSVTASLDIAKAVDKAWLQLPARLHAREEARE